jgi:signal transduction histidine kinase
MILCMGVFSASADDDGAIPATVGNPTPEGEKIAAELGVGSWIWTTNFANKQFCRVWRSFSVPKNSPVKRALVRVTADNIYRLFFDGREIGIGGNWKSLTEYDVTSLLDSGTHVLGIEAVNDSLQAGILFGLRIEFENGERMEVVSDNSWKVVPETEKRWLKKTRPGKDWMPAMVVGAIGQLPWWLHPISTISTPALQPIEVHFWQTGWFLITMFSVCAAGLGLITRLAAQLTLQKRAHKLLELERARIARDIHDDLGAALTQLVLQGEVAQTEFPEGSSARAQFNRISENARAVSQALDEVVWAVNSKRDTLRDFASYICKYAQTFLASTSIRCRLDVEADLPSSVFDLPVRRGLFLAIKEALNNAAKYSRARELFLRIFRRGGDVVVVVEDNGVGFDPAAIDAEGNGLQNMVQRLEDIGGKCQIASAPGAGCRVEFRVSATHSGSRSGFSFRRFLGLKAGG